MSAELMVEVLRYAPASLTPAEKLLLTVIAESCNPTTRMTWYRQGWDASEVARRCQVGVASLGKLFLGLARKGCEVRVAFDTDQVGRPVFARRGHQTTFRMPRLAPVSPDGGPTKPAVSPDEDPTCPGVRSDGGPPRSDGGPTYGPVRSDGGPTLLLKDLSSKNTSSLSPREDEAPALTDVAPEPEREIDNASQKPGTIKTNPVHALLVGAGCPEDLTDDMERELRRRNNIRAPGPAWFRTVSGNGELADHVADALQWSGPDSRVAYQVRTEDRSVRRSTAVSRAEQALAVAAELDQRFPREIRSPADQRVADGALLYAKYKTQEINDYAETFLNPSIAAYSGEP